jgi:parallel beta-helix repeat protein
MTQNNWQTVRINMLKATLLLFLLASLLGCVSSTSTPRKIEPNNSSGQAPAPTSTVTPTPSININPGGQTATSSTINNANGEISIQRPFFLTVNRNLKINLSNYIQSNTITRITTPPAHGDLSIIGNEALYTPQSGYFGKDSVIIDFQQNGVSINMVEYQLNIILGNNYFVDQANLACSDLGNGSANTPWCTITKAAASLKAGDIVEIKNGNYNTPIIPVNSGTAGRPIVFKNYYGHTPIIGGNLDPAIVISRRSHIVLQGLTVKNVLRWLRAIDSHHNIITQMIFDTNTDPNHSARTGLYFESSTHNQIIGNRLLHDQEDGLALINSNYNLVVDNHFEDSYHTNLTIKCGNYNVIRGNYFSNTLEKTAEIFDCYSLSDAKVGYGEDYFNNQPRMELFKNNQTQYNLVEANRFTNIPAHIDHSDYSGIQFSAQKTIIRRNIFLNNRGTGLKLTLYGEEARYTNNNRIYNNIFYKNQKGGSEISGLALSDSHYQLQDNIFKNNIFYNNDHQRDDSRFSWYGILDKKPVQLEFGGLSGFKFDTNLFYHDLGNNPFLVAYGSREKPNQTQYLLSCWQDINNTCAISNFPASPLFANSLIVNPMFRDPVHFDFQLQSTSQLIDHGTFLTKCVGAGSGVNIKVEDPTYFYSGFNIEGESGDMIQLEGSLETAKIVSIDYTTKIITVNKNLSWSNGQNISHSYQGSKPDIGAFEFKSNP